MSTGRKVFHCAVDETALSTNISEVKKWTSTGAINLIVPLYTLERLHALKRAGSQVAINAREAVRFLDRVTSGKDNIPTDRVVLQGPMEQYEKWEDAEQFFLPEYEEEPQANGAVENGQAEQTPSDGEKGSEKDDMSQLLLSKLNFQKDSDAVSMASNRTSSGPPSRQSSRNSRASPEHVSPLANGAATNQGSVHRRSASGSVIPTAPMSLRPLLSALLWRLHSGPDASNAAKACILITNDRTTQIWAQKFGIGTKNIQQLRTSIQYEEREYKNRCKYVEKTQGSQPEPKTLLSYDEESDEDELVFVPRGRGKGPVRASSRGARKTTPAKSVPETVEVPSQPIDPNSFSRSLGTNTHTAAVDAPRAPVAGTSAGGSRGSPSGRRARGVTRGRGRGGGSGRLWVP